MQTKVGLGPSKSPVKSFRHLFCWIFIRPPLVSCLLLCAKVLLFNPSTGANKECLSSQDIELEPGRTLLV
jgi:hypothetical protein